MSVLFSTFKTSDVIVAVQNEPCLWNRSHADFENLHLKKMKWVELASTLIPDFEELRNNEKLKAVSRIQMRWKSAKEEYRKTLLSREKTKYGYFVFKRNYMYYDLMKFMYSHVNINDNEDKLNEAENMRDLPGMITIVPKWSDDKVNYSLVQVLRESAKIINDDDYAFFKSILPMVRNLNPEDGLKFRQTVVNHLLDTKFKSRLQPKAVTETPAFNINSTIDTLPNNEPFVKITQDTLKIKSDIIRKFNEGISIAELATEYKVFEQTIVNLIKKSKMNSSIGAPTGTEFFTKMEQLLLKWIKKKQRKCEILSSIVICQQAMKIYKILKKKSLITVQDDCINFEASESWLESYLNRHGLLSPSNNSTEQTSESRKRKLSDHQDEPQTKMAVKLEISDDESFSDESHFEAFDNPLPKLEPFHQLSEQNFDTIDFEMDQTPIKMECSEYLKTEDFELASSPKSENID